MDNTFRRNELPLSSPQASLDKRVSHVVVFSLYYNYDTVWLAPAVQRIFYYEHLAFSGSFQYQEVERGTGGVYRISLTMTSLRESIHTS